MYDIAAQIQSWLDGGHSVRIAQIVATRGFSSHEPGAALAWTDGGAVGALLPGVDTDLVAAGAQLDGRLVEIAVSESDAVAAGLACGGVATVLVQPASAYPAETWPRLAAREPICLISDIEGDAPAATDLYTPGNVRDAAQRPRAGTAPRLFARGVSDTALVSADDATTAIVTLWPPTTLLVVGDGNIASALEDVGTLLGWTVLVSNDAAAAASAAAPLTESDAVVVLSHDRAVDCPALEAAVSGRVGYVGAMGSRGTQAARRELLTSHGVSDEAQARIHGPAGLDVDAHTPVEIAVSVTAEILAYRTGASGGSLRDRGGPIHNAGVNAPPPRY